MKASKISDSISFDEDGTYEAAKNAAREALPDGLYEAISARRMDLYDRAAIDAVSHCYWGDLVTPAERAAIAAALGHRFTGHVLTEICGRIFAVAPSGRRPK